MRGSRLRLLTLAWLVAALGVAISVPSASAAGGTGTGSGTPYTVGNAGDSPGNTGLQFSGAATLTIYEPRVNGNQSPGGSSTSSGPPPAFGSPCPGGNGVIAVYPQFIMQSGSTYLYEFPDPFTSGTTFEWPGSPPNDDARAILSGAFEYKPLSGTTGGINEGPVTDPTKPPAPAYVATPWGWVYPLSDPASCYGYGLAGSTSCGGGGPGGGGVSCGKDPFNAPWTTSYLTYCPAAACIPGGLAAPADLRVDPNAQWDKGKVHALPDPAQTNSTTFTGVPTCAWVEPAANKPLPQPPGNAVFYEYQEVPATGPHGPILVSLLYTVTVTPGPITWNWGDGSATTTGSGNDPHADPTYNYSDNTWHSDCSNQHTYRNVCPSVTAPTCGRMQITATQDFVVAATVSYATGIPGEGATQPVASWNIPVNWTGPALSVKQIESVPVSGR